MIQVEELLNKLNRARPNGTNQWRASCPCTANHKHGDRSRGFYVRREDTGRIMVYCQAGCSLDEICNALGYKTVDLLPDKAPVDRKKSLISYICQENDLKYIGEYNYCYGKYDDGLCKVRFIDNKDGAKTFKWIHPGGTGKSGYALSHKDCPHRLYVAGDPEADIIYLTEGEKDADTVHRLTGCTAASAENGAVNQDATALGDKWYKEYDEQLKGKTVYILYDNDAPGRRMAELEAERIAKYAKYTCILHIAQSWPECPDDGGDITDLARALGDDKAKSILQALTESAAQPAEVQEPATAADVFDTFISEIQTDKYRPVCTGMSELDELLGGGLLRQSVAILSAAPGVGKTSFCQQLFEGMAANGHNVIFLNLEMSRAQLYARSLSRIVRKLGGSIPASKVLKGYEWTGRQAKYIRQASQVYRDTIHEHMRYNPEGCTTDVESIRQTITEAAEEVRRVSGDPDAPGPIVCVDYLHLCTGEKGEDKTEVIKRALKMLKDYAIRYNTIALAIGANNRQANASGNITLESGRDTSDIEYSGDYVIGLIYRACDPNDLYAIRYRKKYGKVYLEDLQNESPRKLTLKLLKTRMDATGLKMYLDFDASNSTFVYAGKPKKRRRTNEQVEGQVEMDVEDGELDEDVPDTETDWDDVPTV